MGLGPTEFGKNIEYQENKMEEISEEGFLFEIKYKYVREGGHESVTSALLQQI